VAVALALLVPHAFSPMLRPSDDNGLTRVYSGDEPHYLVLINSLIRDGDLDVANNYRDVHEGGISAGQLQRGKALDHHSAWMANGRYVPWHHVYDIRGERWPLSAKFDPVPILNEGMDPSMAATKEYSMHWPGLALLLTPVLFPLRSTVLVEPVALLCAWVAIVLTMLAFVSIARSFGASTLTTIVAVVLTFLGTPLWNYARALFAEPFALACLLGAYALHLKGRRVWLAGLLCGMALLLKATFIMVVAPLGFALLLQKRWKDTLIFGAPLIAAVGVTMLFNHAMFGTYLQGPQQWLKGDIVTGAVGLMTSTQHGLLPFAPVAVCSAIGWPALLREHRRPALVALASVVGLYALIAAFGLWHGGYCYGPRYLVPVLPLMMLGLLTRLRTLPLKPWRCADLVVLGLLSILITARGSIHSWSHWDTHPLTGLFG
jgi:hypothetical protein